MSMPMVELIAYTEGNLGDGAAERFLRAYEHDCAAMSWTGERPETFDDVDQGERSIGLDYCFPKPGPWVKPATERQLLAEVRWLLAWLERISGSLNLVFKIRYDDRDIGWIRCGATDHAISDGLLGIWERDLKR